MQSQATTAAPRKPGRPSMRAGSKSGPDAALILRNIGLAVLAGERPAGRMSVREIAATLGMPESTIRVAIDSARPLVRAMCPAAPPAAGDGPGEDPDDRAERCLRNARRRRTKPVPTHDRDDRD